MNYRHHRAKGTAWVRIGFLLDEWRRLQAAYPALAGWSLRVNPRLSSTLGRATPNRQRIEVAAWLAAERPGEAINTLRHEAAHALAGRRAGHGPAWQAMAVRLGAAPSACSQTVKYSETPNGRRPPRWEIVCPRCGVVGPARRRPRSTRLHRSCRSPVTYRERGTP